MANKFHWSSRFLEAELSCRKRLSGRFGLRFAEPALCSISTFGSEERRPKIGRRLKLARAASGLSLRQLEAKVCNRVSAQTISKYERDLSLPSSGVPIALASALEVSADFLAGKQELILDGIEFRKMGAAGKRERSRFEAMACTFWSAISWSRKL